MGIKLFDLGLIDFRSAWDFQKAVFAQVKGGDLPAALIFCRHYPVITLGRSASKGNILAQADELKKLSIESVEVERGGDVTYHGPGQLTVYPVVNLNHLKKDLHWFLRTLEESIIDCLFEFGIISRRRLGLTGVWVGEKKIASIGICVKNWITFHGLSLNLEQGDLINFNLIRPCGMDIEMTSVETVLGRRIEIELIKTKLSGTFLRLIGEVSPDGDTSSFGSRNVPALRR